MMTPIFSIVCLLYVVSAILPEDEGPPSVQPQFLDQLLEQKRYEELAYYLDMDVEDLGFPRQGQPMGPKRQSDKEWYMDDILLTRQEKREKERARQGLDFKKQANKRWPGKPSLIPVYLTPGLGYWGHYFLEKIIPQMDATFKNRCLRIKIFDPNKESYEDYIYVVNGTKCASNIGKVGKAQALILTEFCAQDTKVIHHEFLHAAGLNHEHTRRDRNKYVRIIWENIRESLMFNYDMYDEGHYQLLGNYDYYSVMHYPPISEVTDLRTMEILDKTVDESRIGTNRMQFSDLNKIGLMYCKQQTMENVTDDN